MNPIRRSFQHTTRQKGGGDDELPGPGCEGELLMREKVDMPGVRSSRSRTTRTTAVCQESTGSRRSSSQSYRKYRRNRLGMVKTNWRERTGAQMFCIPHGGTVTAVILQDLLGLSPESDTYAGILTRVTLPGTVLVAFLALRRWRRKDQEADKDIAEANPSGVRVDPFGPDQVEIVGLLEQIRRAVFGRDQFHTSAHSPDGAEGGDEPQDPQAVAERPPIG